MLYTYLVCGVGVEDGFRREGKRDSHRDSCCHGCPPLLLLDACPFWFFSLRYPQKISFPEMTPRAFVTFKTFSAATVARQVPYPSLASPSLFNLNLF